MPVSSALGRRLQVVARGADMHAAVRAAQSAGQTVGFVPTMGALHDDHLSLVAAARRECDVVAASIFVNPTQFAAGEDFHKYPRPLQGDLDLLDAAGCQLSFVPEASEIYPPGFDSYLLVIPKCRRSRSI